MLDLCNIVLDVEVDASNRGCELLDCGISFFIPAVSDKPPWALRRRPYTSKDQWSPCPLDRDWDPPRPWVLERLAASQYTSGDQLARNPADVDVGRQIRTQHLWGDVASVPGCLSAGCTLRLGLVFLRDCECLEDAPGETEENAPCSDHADVLSKEVDEVESNRERQCAVHGLLVAKPFRNVAISPETDD
jgi:hypothetical protein